MVKKTGYTTLHTMWLIGRVVFIFVCLQMGKNKHVTEGHLTLFINTFPNFSQFISNNNDVLLQGTQALP